MEKSLTLHVVVNPQKIKSVKLVLSKADLKNINDLAKVAREYNVIIRKPIHSLIDEKLKKQYHSVEEWLCITQKEDIYCRCEFFDFDGMEVVESEHIPIKNLLK